MKLGHQLERERRVMQPSDPVAQGGDAAADLAQVVAWHVGVSRADLV